VLYVLHYHSSHLGRNAYQTGGEWLTSCNYWNEGARLLDAQLGGGNRSLEQSCHGVASTCLWELAAMECNVSGLRSTMVRLGHSVAVLVC
jgi:hypothetical protein